MSNRAFARALCATTILCGAFGSVPALAQLAPPAPVRQSIDANGVDLFLGTMNADTPALSMGGDDQGLSYYKVYRGVSSGDNVLAALQLSGSTITVSLGGTSDSFTVSGSTYTPTEGNGATLSYNSGTYLYTYTRADGTIIRFDKSKGNTTPYYANEGRVLDVTLPSGAKLTYSYDSLYFCSAGKPGGLGYICTQHSTAWRIGSVRNSYGYKLTFNYETIDPFDPDDPQDFPDLPTWSTITDVTESNLAVPSSPTRSFSSVSKPSYATGSNGLTGITYPGSGSADVTIAYSSGKVHTLTNAAGTWTYDYADASGVRTVTVTDPLSHVTTYTFDIASKRMTSVTGATGQATGMTYDGSGRLTRVTQQDGNYIEYTYDARGNVTQTRQVAKSGSGLSDIVTSASYPSSCSNPVTCNSPDSTTDARGKVTDYTYDATHGGVLTVTGPAPTTGAPRPQTRYTYTSLQAYFDKGSGIVASGEPVYRVTAISQCQTGSSCAGTSDEVKTTVSYGPQTTGTGNNLLPVSVSTGAGDASLTATSTMTYDAIGNLLSVDGPLSGTSDTITYRYDADRRRVGAISPDPDGAGSLPRRAQRITYDARGRATLVELGTVTGTGDTAWAAFVSLQGLSTSYDGVDRPLVRKLLDTSSGPTVYGVTQYSYDHQRLDCVATRMNSAAWISLPSDACTAQTAGSLGADRIVKLGYDNADRRTSVISAYGTADQSTDQTVTYTTDGLVATLTDGEGNKTSYDYDGFDRLSKTRYPLPSSAGSSSTTDYEQLVYDAGSNVISRRLRGYAGDSTRHIDYGYDNLSRLISKDLPGSEPDVTYSYDLLNRLTGASQTGNALSFTWDALGRNLSQTGPLGTLSYTYDLAGRRTRMTWPDSFYVDYSYLVTGEVTAITMNGTTTGAGIAGSYAYDSLGRMSSLTRGNGVVTSAGFDAVSRLSSLTQNLNGTTSDLTLGFGYNPAGQIASTTRSNDLYAWTAHYNVDRAYTVNGLNQTTLSGSVSLGYDARGNLTSSGSDSYGYSSENLLVSGPGSTSLDYDPLLRLYRVTQGSAATRYLYDGDQRAAEFDASGTVLRRYVFGPGMDEPLVWIEGSGWTTAAKRWLVADERGSVIAVTDSAGDPVSGGINSYDEYGIPGAGNTGAFQYTGQAWLAELGLYYYKARMYSPTLGRFMQADPIGYESGMNLYAYVGGDPVNWRDPSGLDRCPGESAGCQPDDVYVPGNGWGQNYQCPPGWYYFGSGCVSDVRDAFGSFMPYQGSGGGGRQGATPQRTQPKIDRCYARATPLYAGPNNFWVDGAQAITAINEKRIQHSSRVNPITMARQSNFASGITTMGLYTLVQQMAEASAPQLSGGRYRITAPVGFVVGYDYLTDYTPTQFLTVIFTPTGAFDDKGRRIFALTSLYPGC